MKIYTKTGDKGTTALFGGTRVPKHHIRIESYGTVDELNSHIGLIRDQEIDSHYKEILITIQDKLFTVGAILATDPEKAILKSGKERLNIPKISDEDIELLRKRNGYNERKFTTNDPLCTSWRASNCVILSYSTMCMPKSGTLAVGI